MRAGVLRVALVGCAVFADFVGGWEGLTGLCIVGVWEGAYEGGCAREFITRWRMFSRGGLCG